LTEPIPTTPDRRPGLPARDRPVRARRRPKSTVSAEAAEGQEASADLEAEREALRLARRIVDLAADKKAADIVLLEVRELTTLTDYFVICSGGSERQLGGIADGVVEALKHDGTLPIGREGGPTAHWVLIDYGSVIVHVMAAPEREYYALEKLWSDAPLLLRLL
jgi:ribosome-associated protein